MMTKEALILEIKQLPLAERYEVASEAWDSVMGDSPVFVESPEFLAELQRRVDDHDKNPDEGIDWEELRNRLISQFRQARTN